MPPTPGGMVLARKDPKSKKRVNNKERGLKTVSTKCVLSGKTVPPGSITGTDVAPCVGCGSDVKVTVSPGSTVYNAHSNRSRIINVPIDWNVIQDLEELVSDKISPAELYHDRLLSVLVNQILESAIAALQTDE